MVSSFEEKDKIIKYCNDSYKQLYTGNVSLRDISKRSRLRRRIEDYITIGGGVTGIIYYNQQRIGKIENGDSYFFKSLGWPIELIKKDIYQKTLTEWF